MEYLGITWGYNTPVVCPAATRGAAVAAAGGATVGLGIAAWGVGDAVCVIWFMGTRTCGLK